MPSQFNAYSGSPVKGGQSHEWPCQLVYAFSLLLTLHRIQHLGHREFSIRSTDLWLRVDQQGLGSHHLTKLFPKIQTILQ